MACAAARDHLLFLPKEAVMPDETMPRRDFLKGAGAAGAAVATALASSLTAPTTAQTAPPRTSATPASRPADLVLKNGKVITIDAGFTIVQAIAIAGDRVVGVGPDAAMAAHTVPETRVVDLKGKTVIPGLIDGHAHMDREGLKKIYPSLGRVRSIRDIQDRIAELARAAKPGDWIVTMPIGDPPFYFDVPEILAEKRWPTRLELDAAAPNNPVLIRSILGFWRSEPPLVSIANTEALKRAGITRDTIAPVDVLEIKKDAHGDPTGVIVESEMQPIAELIWFRDAARFTRADRGRALSLSAQAYHAYGTTGVFEEHGIANEVLRAYKDAHRDGTLTMRSALVFSPNWKAMGSAPLGPFIEAWAGWLSEPALGDDWLKVTGLYVNIEHRPADDLRATAAPYTGWSGFNYDTGLPPERLEELLLLCAHNDIRAIANANLTPGVVDIFERVDKKVALKGRRWVIGHVGLLSQRNIEKIARMEIVITPHTNSSIYKAGHLLLRRLPPERHREITPLRDLVDAGVKVGLVTDNVPISLFWPIWESVARLARVTNERVAPEQAITGAEALRCATINGAYLSFDEGKRGSLEPGKLADLAVLSGNPLTVEEKSIADITSLMTMVGGRIVHQSPNWTE
jgi:predicted amidohydrolase YtcJ